MYLPKYCQVTDRAQMLDFIKSNGFGILLPHTGLEPMASHLPFILDEDGVDQGLILGHMARANDQWEYANGQPVLVVFHGPHAYISPTWYQVGDTVLTWNYVAVHASGLFKAVEDREGIEDIVGRVTDYYESSQPQPWQADFTTAYAGQMIKRIVAFKIEITRLQGKWKLNQNHPERRRRRVAEQLKIQGGGNDGLIARLMDEDLPPSS